MTSEEVLQDVAKRFDVKASDIKGRSRLRHIAAARHAYWLGLRELGWSYPAIGIESKVDHSTVILGCRKAESTRNGVGEKRHALTAAENMRSAGDLMIKAVRQMVEGGMKRDQIFNELSALFTRARKEIWS